MDKPPKIIAVAMDHTMYMTDVLRSEVKGVRGIYLYDETSRTFCCEITPSFFLRWVDVALEYADDISDKRKDELYDEFRESYAANDPDIYMHVRDVERGNLEHKVFMEGNDFEPWWKEYDEHKIWDEVLEAYNQCPVF